MKILTYNDMMERSARYNKQSKEEAQAKVDEYNNASGRLPEGDNYHCEICKNKGNIEVVKHNEEEDFYYEYLEACKCQRVRDVLRKAKEGGLGDVITDFTFKKFIATEDWQKTIKELAQAFCNDDNAKWFFIGGQVGSGKTHLCTGIVAQYLKKGIEAQYMLWVEESKKLKAVVNDLVAYKNLIEPFKNAPVLYIDDFLKTRQGEMPTNADINLAFEIINHRLMDKSKVTIISSEKTLKEMLAYDEATMSRIYQCAGKYKANIDRDSSRNYRLRG